MHPNKSLYVKSPWQFQVCDNPVNDPAPGQLLIEIRAAAVCGTDNAIADRLADKWQVFGHEVSGIVRSIGAGVDRFREGDGVALDSSAPCGKCSACQPGPYGTGRPDLCRTPATYWDWPAMGFGNFLVTPAECAVQIPEGMPFETACLTEPLGVSLDLVQTAEISQADDVLIVGGGPLGLGAAAVSLMRGAQSVKLAMFSHSTARIKAAESLGVSDFIFNDKEPFSKKNFGARKPNKILVTAPPPVIPEALSIAPFGGIVAFIGIAFGTAATIAFDADCFHFNKLQLRASHASPAIHAAESLRLLELHPEWGSVLVSHRVPMEQIGERMLEMRKSRADFVKIVGVNNT